MPEHVNTTGGREKYKALYGKTSRVEERIYSMLARQEEKNRKLHGKSGKISRGGGDKLNSVYRKTRKI